MPIDASPKWNTLDPMKQWNKHQQQTRQPVSNSWLDKLPLLHRFSSTMHGSTNMFFSLWLFGWFLSIFVGFLVSESEGSYGKQKGSLLFCFLVCFSLAVWLRRWQTSTLTSQWNFAHRKCCDPYFGSDSMSPNICGSSYHFESWKWTNLVQWFAANTYMQLKDLKTRTKKHASMSISFEFEFLSLLTKSPRMGLYTGMSLLHTEAQSCLVSNNTRPDWFIWMFPKIGIPQNGWLISWKTLLLKLMIWGYHYSWKHPYRYDMIWWLSKIVVPCTVLPPSDRI